MPVVVKICGITSIEDALAASAAGADALGFMFYEKSTRYLPVPVARQIISAVPKGVSRVGVFVNAPVEFVREAIQECELDILQFHGEETPEYCAGFGLMTIKAFRVRNAESLEPCSLYATSTWLLDSYTPGLQGGTGERFDWDVAVGAHKFARPFFLAGGLTPTNVAEAVRRVRPFGVDVSSGVESAPGKKDASKVKEFVRAAKEAARALLTQPKG